MKQQIIVSGLGGQGALTVTRLLAEAAAALGLEVITSETHGMAQRGGTVISMVKVGPFRGPLIPAGAADVGLFLHEKNLGVHRSYLAPGGPGLRQLGRRPATTSGSMPASWPKRWGRRWPPISSSWASPRPRAGSSAGWNSWSRSSWRRSRPASGTRTLGLPPGRGRGGKS